MDCLAIFCLSSFFMKGGLGIQNQIDRSPAGYYHPYDRNITSPWVADVQIGFEREVLPHLTWTVSYRHESMPTLHDLGQDALWSEFTWRPFR